jgi:hypothetical protein
VPREALQRRNEGGEREPSDAAGVRATLEALAPGGR